MAAKRPTARASTTLPSVDVSVIIPTFNGEKYLNQIFTALAAQKYDGSFEVLVIDSGSSDHTLEIISRRLGNVGPAKLRVHRIPNSEFGHGKTRNLAAELAHGRLLVFLSHDAVPLGTGWLSRMVAPLSTPRVVGVFARHIPRRNCPPLLKYEIDGVFDACGRRDVISIEQLSTNELRDLQELAPNRPATDVVPNFEKRAFYSDVASATTRDFLLHVIPYQDLPYSEDIAFGRDILRAGHAKVYTPLAPVEHSNDVTFGEYGKRIFDETLGLRRVGAARAPLSWLQAAARAKYGSLRDVPRILRDPDYSFASKLGWLCANPWWQWRKWMNIRRALRVNLKDFSAFERYSLEAARARRA